MGWRFRRRLTLFPGVRINFSSKGISTTFGVPGASVNIGSNGAYLNTGIPGTGFYNRTKINFGSGSNKVTPQENEQFPTDSPNYFVPEGIGAIKSADNNSITSKGLLGVKETLFAAYKEKQSLQAEVNNGKAALEQVESRLKWMKIFSLNGLLFKRTLLDRQNEYKECKASLLEATKQSAECKVSIEVQIDPSLIRFYESFKKGFDNLKGSQHCWDITSSIYVDRVKTRSSASQSINRQKVSFTYSSLDFVNSEYPAFNFKNVNGADLFFYPAFLIAFHSKSDFALIDYKEMSIDYSRVSFVETENVPNDSIVLSRTWQYVNKNGSRDMRFSNNYEIPVMLYGELDLKSSAGLNESYMFSNATAAEEYVNSYARFKNALSGDRNQETQSKKESVTKPQMSKAKALHTLGLSSSATSDQIRTAYIELIQKYHPDKVSHLADEFKMIAETKTKDIISAYSILTQQRF
ncbi:MAG: DUF4236 domain-containing protein [Bacteroidota bacterium]